jgi:hypothetical protein
VVFMDIFFDGCGSKPTTNNTLALLQGKTNMKTKTTHPLALALVTIAAAALPAAAQSDTVIYTPTSFSMTIPESSPTASEFLPAFAPVPNLPDQAILMIEPGGTAANPIVSDELWVQAGFLYFASDDVNGVLPPIPTTIPVVATVVEDGTLQDLGILLKAPGGALGLPPNELLVSSDISDTPEPSTIALLGIGGAVGAASFLRRRKI